MGAILGVWVLILRSERGRTTVAPDERFSVLTARKLLILRMARRSKKASLPIPLYVYCTKILALRCDRGSHRLSIPQFAGSVTEP
jgi:hypothetical protein